MAASAGQLLSTAIAAVVLSAGVRGGGFCTAPRWKELYRVLDEAYRLTAYNEGVSSEVRGVVLENGDWYRANYQACVEGFLSLMLYLSIQEADRAELLLRFASEVARELNPLALRHGLSSWPLFGRVGQLDLVWQAGERTRPLDTDPWRPSPCAEPAPGIVSPLMAALKGSIMHILRGLRPGALVVDAGVFDGTDWAKESVLAGATVLGFEPSARNLRLFQERFPPALAAARPELVSRGTRCKRHTVLRVEPGEEAPRGSWADQLLPGVRGDCAEPASPDTPALGHVVVLGAALGEQVRALNVTARYDYTSIADQGYLRGPKDMIKEEIAMTTLDRVFATYSASAGASAATWIDVLKVDVEGYEMGALRGAEQLLADGRVRYVVLEFHPGMLGTTGTDPRGLLEFLRHYCFFCHSLKTDRPYSFEDFVARYTSDPSMLPMQGLGALEDLVCQNIAWRPPL